MTNEQAFLKLISLYEICDQLRDINEDETAKRLQQTINKLADFIIQLAKP